MSSSLINATNLTFIQNATQAFSNSLFKQGFKIVFAALIFSTIACYIKMSEALKKVKTLQEESKKTNLENQNLISQNSELEIKNEKLESYMEKLAFVTGFTREELESNISYMTSVKEELEAEMIRLSNFQADSDISEERLSANKNKLDDNDILDVTNVIDSLKGKK